MAVCGFLLAMLSACEPSPVDLPVLGTLERDRIELTADSNEPIRAILVREGDRVRADDALLVQDQARAEALLARAQADEATARAALAEAEKGPRAQAITQARARLEATRSARITARHELDRQASLVERNFGVQNQLDILKGRLDEAKAREEEARALLDELLEGTRNERVDQARSQFAAAVANVRSLQINIDRATVRAPVDGQIDAVPFDLGERPAPGVTVAVLLATAPTYARVHIPEPLRTLLKPGDAALVHMDSHPDPLPAVVRWISADASFTPYFALSQHDRTRLSFVAEIDLTDPAADLPIGVPVEVTFPDIPLEE